MAPIGATTGLDQLPSGPIDPIGWRSETRLVKRHDIVLGRHRSGASSSAHSDLVGCRRLNIFNKDGRQGLYIVRD